MENSRKVNSSAAVMNETAQDLLDGMSGSFVPVRTVRSMGQAIIDFQSIIVMVFLRSNFGTAALSGSKIFWAWAWLSLLCVGDFVLSNGANVPMGWGVTSLMTLHLLLFLCLAIYHSIEARNALRNRHERRYSETYGFSLLYPAFSRFFKDEFTFQKWGEPLIVAGLGILCVFLGFNFYGYFLVICALSMLSLKMTQEDAYWAIVQQKIDADYMGDIIKMKSEEDYKEYGMPVPTDLKKMRAAFKALLGKEIKVAPKPKEASMEIPFNPSKAS